MTSSAASNGLPPPFRLPPIVTSTSAGVQGRHDTPTAEGLSFKRLKLLSPEESLQTRISSLAEKSIAPWCASLAKRNDFDALILMVNTGYQPHHLPTFVTSTEQVIEEIEEEIDTLGPSAQEGLRAALDAVRAKLEGSFPAEGQEWEHNLEAARAVLTTGQWMKKWEGSFINLSIFPTLQADTAVVESGEGKDRLTALEAAAAKASTVFQAVLLQKVTTMRARFDGPFQTAAGFLPHNMEASKARGAIQNEMTAWESTFARWNDPSYSTTDQAAPASIPPLLSSLQEKLEALSLLVDKIDPALQPHFEESLDALQIRLDGPFNAAAQLTLSSCTSAQAEISLLELRMTFWKKAIAAQDNGNNLLGLIYGTGLTNIHPNIPKEVEEQLTAIAAQIEKEEESLRPALRESLSRLQEAFNDPYFCADFERLCDNAEAIMARIVCEHLLSELEPSLLDPHHTTVRNAARVILGNLLLLRSRVLEEDLILTVAIAEQLDELGDRVVDRLETLKAQGILRQSDIEVAFLFGGEPAAGAVLEDMSHFSALNVFLVQGDLAIRNWDELPRAVVKEEVDKLLDRLPAPLQIYIQARISERPSEDSLVGTSYVEFVRNALEKALEDPAFKHFEPPSDLAGADTETTTSEEAPVTPRRMLLREFVDELSAILYDAYAIDPRYAPYRNLPRSDTDSTLRELQTKPLPIGLPTDDFDVGVAVAEEINNIAVEWGLGDAGTRFEGYPFLLEITILAAERVLVKS